MLTTLSACSPFLTSFFTPDMILILISHWFRPRLEDREVLLDKAPRP